MIDLSLLTGDDAGPWLVQHRLTDGTYADVTIGGYSCRLTCQGVSRAVTDIGTNDKGNGFLAYLTPAETAGLTGETTTLAVQIRNPNLVPPLSREKHIKLKLEQGLIADA